MKLEKFIVEKPWGRSDLPAIFGVDPGNRTGEVWFDEPEGQLPILVKWLFTSEKLSIQVHPDDDDARERGLESGKEECWFVVSAEPDAVLGIGLKEELSPERLREAIADGSIEALMEWRPVRAGDYYYIPAGTVHAIGAGVTIVEVQQNADVTYRLYDYGRPRELHLEEGLSVSRTAPYDTRHAGRVADVLSRQVLVDSRHFTLLHARGHRIQVEAEAPGPCWIIPLEGALGSEHGPIAVGECAYFETAPTLDAGPDAVALVARSNN